MNPRPRRRVKCQHHGEREGYVVCRCIVDQGAAVARLVTPAGSPLQGIGSIMCERPDDDHALDDLVLICDACAIARGWAQSPAIVLIPK